MSTPVPAPAISTPRAPADRRTATQPRPASTDGATGVFAQHGWLVPVTGIACVIAVFVAMVLLTWLAGGETPFDR